MFKLVLCVTLFFSSFASLAQETKNDNSVVQKYGPRRQISTIVYMGLAGAVLGLSTLSFYGRPQDHLTNIPLGFGVGVIIGTIYMTYQAAANPTEFYRPAEYRPEFKTQDLKIVMVADYYYRPVPPSFTYRWDF